MAVCLRKPLAPPFQVFHYEFLEELSNGLYNIAKKQFLKGFREPVLVPNQIQGKSFHSKISLMDNRWYCRSLPIIRRQ